MFLFIETCQEIYSEKYILNYARADNGRIIDMLASFTADFANNFQNRTVHDNWSLFRDKLKEVETTCIPRMTISSRQNDPWFNREVKKCINKKKERSEKLREQMLQKTGKITKP